MTHAREVETKSNLLSVISDPIIITAIKILQVVIQVHKFRTIFFHFIEILVKYLPDY